MPSSVQDSTAERTALLPPPHYAEHTKEILMEHLGISGDDVKELAELGAVAMRE